MADTDKKYQVLFYGEISPGADIEQVKDNLAKAFKADRDQIEALFTGQKKVVKKNASRSAGLKIKRIFESAGAVCVVLSQGDQDDRTGVVPPEKSAAADVVEGEAGTGQNSRDPVDDSAGQSSFKKPPPVPVARETRDTHINKIVLMLLTFFLGALGVHKFYLGKYLQGVLYLLFCWTAIPALIALIEFVLYALTSEEEINNRYSPGSSPLVIIMAVISPVIAIILVTLVAIIVTVFLLASHSDSLSAAFFKLVSSGTITDLQATTFGPAPPSSPATPDQAGPASPQPGQASGKIRGLDFTVEQASVQNQAGVLDLKQGEDSFADQEIIIFLFLNQESVSEKTFDISPDDDTISRPHIHLRWRTEESGPPQSSVIMNDYTLRLTFDRIIDDSVKGHIDLTIPGDRETYVRGDFTAIIKDQ
ncbi:MAG: TM2 domain-containing protein [Desulfosudaceae bacterium]